MTRRSTRPSSAGAGRRYALAALALLLVAAGFYFGFRMAQPPPPPDFAALRGETPAPSGRRSEKPASVASSRAAGTGAKAPDAAGATTSGEARSSGGGTDGGTDEEGETVGAPGTAGEGARTAVATLRQLPPGRQGRPRVAIVVDDLGRSLADLETLARLGVPLTYAVLPFEVRTESVLAALRARNAEVFCHLPMEAKGGANPGPGALLTSMTDAELRQATRAALDAVPGAIAANNHMGSAVAADQRSMAAVLGVLRERGVWFLDSRTSSDTVGFSLARQLGVPAAERQVFLDTRRDRAFVEQQFQALLEQAAERGGAIAIGHPYAVTLDVLAAEIPKAQAAGFEFVKASQLFDS